jgi:hypothetical protein
MWLLVVMLCPFVTTSLPQWSTDNLNIHSNFNSDRSFLLSKREYSWNKRWDLRSSYILLTREVEAALQIASHMLQVKQFHVRMALRGGDQSIESFAPTCNNTAATLDLELQEMTLHTLTTSQAMKMLAEAKLKTAEYTLELQEAKQKTAEAMIEAEEAKQTTIKLQASIVVGETSFGELINSPLPPLDDLSSLESSYSQVQQRKVPTDVREWKDFNRDLQNHRRNIPAVTLDSRPYRKLSRPVNSKGCVYESMHEAQIYLAFTATICVALDALFHGTLWTSQFADSRLVAIQGLRAPDLVSVTRGADGESKTVAVIELKRHNLLINGRDLVTCYHEAKRMIEDMVFQITADHFVYKCKFGFVSTYHFTWATFLDSDGVLYISPAFNSDYNGEMSVLNMMYYVLSKACDELNDEPLKWTPPSALDDARPRTLPQATTTPPISRVLDIGGVVAGLAQSGSSSEPIQKRGRRKLRSKVSGRSYKIVGVLFSVHGRVAYQALTSNNTRVVVKCYLYQHERDNEVECYNWLHELQGDCIPQLLEPSCSYPGEEQNRTHGLVISWVGSPDAGSYRMLPTTALEQARRIVLEMHERGVAHRDIRPLNMIYSFSTTKLHMLDFGQSETVDMIGKNYFDQACFEDLSELDRLIEISRTRRFCYFHLPKEWQTGGLGLVRLLPGPRPCQAGLCKALCCHFLSSELVIVF